jgi:hypothetical protein
MNMTAKDLSFWLVAASELGQPEIFDFLAETLTSSPQATAQEGIDLWVERVMQAQASQAQEVIEEAEKAQAIAEVLVARSEDE